MLTTSNIDTSRVAWFYFGSHIILSLYETCYTKNILVCPAGQEYNSCGSVCPSTCEQQPDDCGGECIEGCFCIEGTVLHDGTCIPPEQCPCVLDDGSILYNGATATILSVEECYRW